MSALQKINANLYKNTVVLQTYKSSRWQSNVTLPEPGRKQEAFPLLEDTLCNTATSTLAVADGITLSYLDRLAHLSNICLNGGGAKARERYQKYKILPRDKIEKLWDNPEEETLEIGLLAGLGMPYGDVPGASIVASIGKIHGRYSLVSASDGTLKGGAYYPISVKKQIHANLLADKCGLPLVSLVDSGGAFLPKQAEIFPDKMHGGRNFFMEADFGSRGLPSVSIVCGSCTAGAAYGPSMCEEAVIVDKLGTLFLGGPPLVKAALGEEISAEELGGATMHSSVSGVMDYFARDELESFNMARDVIATTNFSKEHEPEREPATPLYSAQELDTLAGKTLMDRSDMLAIIARLADGSRFREYKQKYGKNLTVGYSFIQGHCIGIVANSGALTYEDGMKGSHFLQLCQHRDLPVLFLQNSADAIQAQKDWHAEDVTAALRGRAAMSASIACLTVPKICLNVGGCLADDHYTMCGPGFEPTFHFSWPAARLAHGTDNNQGFQGGAMEVPGTKFVEGSSWYAAAHILIDGIIAPHDSRKIVSMCLDISRQRQRLQFQPKRFPVYRF